jgi:cell division septation protein DedD
MFEQFTKFANEATDTLTDTLTDAINDNDLGERFTTTSDQVLDAVLDANRRIVDMAVTTADRVVEQLNVELPDRLPTPAEAGERYLDFVERAVSLNRDMNQRVAEMIKADNAKAASDKVVGAAKNVADTATKTVTETAKTVAKQVPAAKAPAKKAPARKAPAKKAAATRRPARKVAAKKVATKKAATSK